MRPRAKPERGGATLPVIEARNPCGFLAPFTPSTRSIAPRCGLKMEVVMIPDKCGREKTVGLRFLSSTGYNAPTV